MNGTSNEALQPEGRIVVGTDVAEIVPFLQCICAIEAETFGAPWKEGDFRNELAHRESVCIILLYDGNCAGYLFAKVACGEVNVNKVCVCKELRGKGLGRILLRYLLDSVQDNCDRVFLEVDTTNTAAIRLYTSLGFHSGRVRKGIYENGNDAIEMVCQL